jgi:hypothetical protein
MSAEPVSLAYLPLQSVVLTVAVSWHDGPISTVNWLGPQ